MYLNSVTLFKTNVSLHVLPCGTIVKRTFRQNIQMRCSCLLQMYVNLLCRVVYCFSPLLLLFSSNPNIVLGSHVKMSWTMCHFVYCFCPLFLLFSSNPSIVRGAHTRSWTMILSISVHPMLSVNRRCLDQYTRLVPCNIFKLVTGEANNNYGYVYPP